VRDADGQALACVDSRENEAEARQAKVLTAQRRDGSPSTLRGCWSYWGKGALDLDREIARPKCVTSWHSANNGT
jgi:hypothetical protein